MVRVTKISYKKIKEKLIRVVDKYEGYPLSSLKIFNYGDKDSVSYDLVYVRLTQESVHFYIVPDRRELKPTNINNYEIIAAYLAEAGIALNNGLIMPIYNWDLTHERMIDYGF